ncbi:hypothetical protein FD754_001213 [Muntiacus muntjak]|uniref:40S ribosomal protein S25 n=1 Tax=Muntiacus muntjak TaxID=9888 RepID=A0A5N3W731_MUNMU|nr:hypothetical protein FD754_001213 [Muntiacus muntjak]
MPPKDDKKKDARKSAKKDKDPVNQSGGMAKKNCNYKLITPAVVSERLKIHGSQARATLQELLSKGLIKLVSKDLAQMIYTRNTKGGDAPAAGENA